MMIENNLEYKDALKKAYDLMNKGDGNISEKEAKELETIAKAVEYYEDNILKLMPIPVTIIEVVQQKVAEMDITQKQLAAIFGISTPKLSQILNGKRQPDISFLKSVHEKFGIDGNFLLETVEI